MIVFENEEEGKINTKIKHVMTLIAHTVQSPIGYLRAAVVIVLSYQNSCCICSFLPPPPCYRYCIISNLILANYKNDFCRRWVLPLHTLSNIAALCVTFLKVFRGMFFLNNKRYPNSNCTPTCPLPTVLWSHYFLYSPRNPEITLIYLKKRKISNNKDNNVYAF